MKITPSQWIKLVQLISTFIIGVITALTVQSCTASMSVFWKNQNSKQDSKQTTQQRVDSVTIKPNFLFFLACCPGYFPLFSLLFHSTAYECIWE